MEAYPVKCYSRPGRSSAETIKILKNPLDVFKISTSKISTKRHYVYKLPIKIDMKEILDSSRESNHSKTPRTSIPPLTSSFLTQSRESWYKPKIHIVSPHCAHYTPNYSFTDRHVSSPKLTLPIINKIKNNMEILKNKKSSKRHKNISPNTSSNSIKRTKKNINN